MNHSKPNTSASSKSWWAAVLVGLVVVLAMGAALIRVQDPPAEPRLAVLPAAAEQRIPDDASPLPTTSAQSAAQAPASTTAVSNAPNSEPVQVEITDKPRPV